MANENKAFIEAKPGDPITAGIWRDMQMALRREHIDHRHTGTWKDGRFDGERLGPDGLADGAVTNPRIADGAVNGAKVDPGSDLRVRSLTISGASLPVGAAALTVNGPVATGGALSVGGPLTVAGALQTQSSLSVANALNAASTLSVGGALLANSTLSVAGALTANGPLTVAGALSANGGLSVSGRTSLTGPNATSNALEVQRGSLHMNGNPIYLRQGTTDQFDIVRWNAGTDMVDMAGFNGTSLGYTKGGATPAFTSVLTVGSNYVEAGTSQNPLRFTSGWSGWPDGRTNGAEIANDTGTYQALMIVGNKSAGGNRRVRLWDFLEVNGALSVTGTVSAAAYNLRFYTTNFAIQNAGTSPNTVSVNYGHLGLVEVYACFATLSGFSLFGNNSYFESWGAVVSADAIPQHAFVKVMGYSLTAANVKGYCSESRADYQGDNTVLGTLLVIGRSA